MNTSSEGIQLGQPKICFFHRNTFHDQIFPLIGKQLAKSGDIQCLHLKRAGKISGSETVEYEKEISKRFDNAKISVEDLRSLEKKYNTSNLLRLIYADRDANYFKQYFSLAKISYEYQLKYLASCIELFEEFLDDGVSCVVTDLSTGIADVFKYVCDKRGVDYITIRASKLSSGFFISDNHYDIPRNISSMKSRFEREGVPAEISRRVEEHIEDIRGEIYLPKYMEVTSKKFKLLKFSKIRSAIFHYKESKKNVSHVSFEKNPILLVFLINLWKIRNILEYRIRKAKFFSNEIPATGSYVVFPLQYEPENSTAIRAYSLSNQVATIEAIAKALPLGAFVVVKEHKGNQGYRKFKDYKNLWYLPNVILAPPELSVSKLIDGCSAVVTLTSRMGWEAIIKGKNVLVLGKTFYTDLAKSGTRLRRPLSWIEMKSDLRDFFYTPIIDIPKVAERDLKNLAAAYMAAEKDGKYLFASEGVTSIQNVRKIASSIMEHIFP